MAERLRTYLLVAILMAATAGATASILGLETRAQDRSAVMVIKPSRPPAQWHGWQLIPPSADTQSCEKDGYDACSDGQGGDDDASGPTDDNEPTSI